MKFTHKKKNVTDEARAHFRHLYEWGFYLSMY